MPKISALTADTSPTVDDLLAVVNDPGGTPATKRVTIADLFLNRPFHGVKAYNAATQAITGGVATAVVLDSEEFDTDAYHDTSSNNTRITIPSGMGGYYRLSGFIYTVSNPGFMLSWIKKNNTTDLRPGPIIYSGISGGGLSYETIVALVATDYVELYTYLGGSVNIGHASNTTQQCLFAAEFLGK